MLFDPFEKEFNLPTFLVDFGYLRCTEVEDIGKKQIGTAGFLSTKRTRLTSIGIQEALAPLILMV